ncbi:MAG: aldehyde dehydrogenase family protein [Polyangia bacterium]|nr:aldehyde dehydrogenase family protein [Polyangia bacterium]
METHSNEKPRRLRCLSPWDGSEIGDVDVDDAPGAKLAVERARAAQVSWAEAGFSRRASLLIEARDLFVKKAPALVELLVKENGKPPVEAWYSEILPNVELFTYWAKSAERFLRPEKVKLERTKYPGKSARVHLVPKGVIAVISAWNYPVALSLRAIVPALMAGNTVVFKPSSEALLVSKLLMECFEETLPKDVLVPFYGPGEAGSRIIEAGVDHLAFIGSVEVGREVAALAARRFTSVALELGGKDAAIVLEDADLDRVVEGIVWGAFTNGGQNCASIERLLVHRSIADALIPRLVTRIEALRVCASERGACDVGPLRSQGQLDSVRRQLDDALGKGARVLVGGKAAGDGRGFGFAPTLLGDVTGEMLVWTEETFGPLLPLRLFSNLDEAISLANDTRYGLTSSIWTSDLDLARDLAPRLRCGVVTANNHAFTAAMPFVPWGGTGLTGLGSTNGRQGLMEMVRPQLVLTDKAKGHEFFWYPYDEANLGLAKALLGFITGQGGLFKVLGLIKRSSRTRAAQE